MLCESLFWYCVNLYCAFIYESSMQPETLIAICVHVVLLISRFIFFSFAWSALYWVKGCKKKVCNAISLVSLLLNFSLSHVLVGLFECVDANMKGNENKLNNIEKKIVALRFSQINPLSFSIATRYVCIVAHSQIHL